MKAKLIAHDHDVAEPVSPHRGAIQVQASVPKDAKLIRVSVQFVKRLVDYDLEPEPDGQIDLKVNRLESGPVEVRILAGASAESLELVHKLDVE